MRSFSTRTVTEIGLMVGLATVLSLIKVYQAPFGGSVTAGSMIPIFFIAFRWGTGSGLAAGALHGIIQLILDHYLYHPLQVILDYPLAFAVLGLAGLFRTIPLVGVLLGILGRFTAHFFSGVIFFAKYAPEGMSPWLYSAVYNGSYLLLEAAVSIVIIYLLPKGLRHAQGNRTSDPAGGYSR